MRPCGEQRPGRARGDAPPARRREGAMTAALEIASDIHCPWAYVCVLRLIRTRDELGLDVVLRHLYWPLELVNGRGAPRNIFGAEVPVVAHLEPDDFAAWRGPP